MTEFETRYDPLLDETCVSFTHKSGLKVLVMPKKHTSLCAMIGTRYGSLDRVFRIEGEKEFTAVPDGVAHFLEHKLFEDENGQDALNLFADLGGDANAGTDFDYTCYYFTASENYEKNLAVLLDFVTHPCFKAQSVERERGIIGQEIKMYQDLPEWRLFSGVLNSLYSVSPVKVDIVGTTESIAAITPQVLYRCYDTFYSLSNMILAVCGDITTESVERLCDACLPVKRTVKYELGDPQEPRGICQKNVTCMMDVAQPLYAIGFKDVPITDGKESLQREFAHSMILRAVFGTSGGFYEKNYRSGLINKHFGAYYNDVRGAAFTVIEGAGDRYEESVDAVLRQLREVRNEFIPHDDFERAKKAFYASFLQSFDSTSGISDAMLQYALQGVHIFDVPELITSVTYEQAREYFMSLYSEANCGYSLVLPTKNNN